MVARLSEAELCARDGARGVELGVGVDVALFGSIRVAMTSDAFVEFRGLLEAGHATQRRCSADLGGEESHDGSRQPREGQS
jgi:hypothetical protein